jgi:hypothetical protein
MAELHLTGERLAEIADYCWGDWQRHPTAYFVIYRICTVLSDEYDNQAVTTQRYGQVNNVLADVLSQALEHPDDMTAINDLVRAFMPLIA